MLKVITVLLVGLAIGLIAPNTQAQDSCVTFRLSVDGEFGAGPVGYLPTEIEVKIPIRFTNLNCLGDKFTVSHAWRIYSPDDAVWADLGIIDLPIHLDPPIAGYPNDILFSDLYSTTFLAVWPGVGEDTVGYAAAMFEEDAALFDGFNYNAVAITLMPDPSSVGRTICIDILPDVINGYEGEWGYENGDDFEIPEWNGPYCFEIIECGDVNGSGGLDSSDVSQTINHLFGAGGPGVTPAADVDGCDGVDVADLVLMIDYIIGSGTDLCSYEWECSPQLSDVAVRLEMVHRPNVATNDYQIEVDLSVHSTVPITAASMGLTWDLPRITLDSVVPSPEAESLFNYGFDSQVEGGNQRVKMWGLDSPPDASGAILGQWITWGTLYFSAPGWLPDDSVTFDLESWDNGSKLRFVVPPDHSYDFLGFEPRFNGPLVVRDAGDYGDVNGNGNMDVEDIVDFLDYLLLGIPFEGPADAGNVDMCDGTDIADLYYLIEQVYLGAPALSEASCDYEVPGDTIGMKFTSVPGWGAGSPKALTGEPLELELIVNNTNAVLGATMGFSWSAKNPNNPGEISNLNLLLDSAKGTALTITGFDAGIEFFEGGSLATSNSNSHFQFIGSAASGSPGVDGNPDQRLWARYYFTLTNFQEGDVILIDTTEYSDGTTFKMASGDLGGYESGWDPDIIFDCCGSYTSGRTGNVNWENLQTRFRCDSTGNRNLADITRLIDYVYISKQALCCHEDGNVNGDLDGKINLADITDLINHIYIAKPETASCL